MSLVKKLILSSSVVLLSGCSTLTTLYDAYFMAGYDNQEYALINTIRTNAELNVDNCADAEASKKNFQFLYGKALEFKNFTQYIPDNVDSYKLATNIYQLAKQGKDAYNGAPASTSFCKLKLQQIVRSTETAQKVIGSKPR